MSRFISITKAAHLANITTRELQSKIDSNQLTVTRGHILVEDLVDCFPEAKIDEADMVAWVEKIKEESFAAGVKKNEGAVSINSLQAENAKLKMNLNYYREQSQKFEDLVLNIRDYLEGLQKKLGKSQRAEGLIKWIDQKIMEIRKNK